MKIVPTKVLVYHAPKSDSIPPCDSWLQYWSETLGVEIPKSGYVKCDCCGKNRHIKDFVGAHVVYIDTVYIYPTCNICNSTYKNHIYLKENLWHLGNGYVLPSKIINLANNLIWNTGEQFPCCLSLIQFCKYVRMV